MGYDPNFPSIRDRKTEIRNQYLAVRRAVSAEEKKLFDASICTRVCGLVSYRYADVILSFSPLKGEVDVSEINEKTLKCGKTLALPRCRPNTPIIDFHVVSSLDELELGSYSIYEPKASCPILNLADYNSAVCLVPAVVFDTDGYRIGYGKGYYDRFLSQNKVTAIGVAYNQFITPPLPRGKFDLAVDVIVTDQKIITVKR